MSKFYTYTSVKGSGGSGGGGAGVPKVADSIERLTLSAAHGDLVVQLDNDTLYEYDGASWIVIGPGGGSGVSNAIDTNTVDITIAGADISADVLYQSSDTVMMSEDVSGLKADVQYQTSDTISISADAGGLVAEVEYQSSETVGITEDAGGLKAEVLYQNTNSVELSNDGSGLLANLKLSGEQADSGYYNADVLIENDGLHVQIPRLWQYPGSRMLHVSKDGNDTTGTGMLDQPFLTVNKSLSVITNATTNNRYFVMLGPGTFSETLVELKPYTWIVGYYRGGSRISGANITLHSDFASTGARTGLYNLYLTGSSGLNFDLQTIGGAASIVVEMGQIFTNNAFTFKGRAAGLDFVEWYGGGYVFGTVTIDVGNFDISNAIFFGNVNVYNSGAAADVTGVFRHCDFNGDYNQSSSGGFNSNVSIVSSALRAGVSVDEASSILEVDATSLRAESSINLTNGGILDKTTEAYSVAYVPTTSGDWATQPENVKEALDILAQAAGNPVTYVSIALENNSGSTIPAETPVCIDANGDITVIDVADASAEGIVGVTVLSIVDGVAGEIAISGKIKDILATVTYGPCFVSDTGTLSSVKPEIGVGTFASGDYVLRVGNIAKSQENPSNKDLIINPQVVGKL